MKTSIIGYPRIGALRELKFASEKYFRGEIDSVALENVAKEIRKNNFLLQKENNIDYIPSNDFSFYDGFLDTAVLFNIIPKRYTELKLNKLDTYFAMARGYQGDNGDVKALAMKKWFNTNYHYMVAEIEDDTKIELSDDKPFRLYNEALSLGVKTKPVIVGAYTLLKLARYKGTKNANDFVTDTIKAYSDFLSKFNGDEAVWVQFDEPALVLDMSKEDIDLFLKLYNGILANKGNVKVIAQTYFGDIRDCYNEVLSLDFDGIGLDFVEGKKTLELISSNGFKDGKVLFAGVVNGKNIWKNDYSKTLPILETISKSADEVVIGTSCSLLHVPCTLDNEDEMADEYKKHLSYAKEKLSEINELSEIDINDYRNCRAYQNNVALKSETRSGANLKVRELVANLSNDDFTRKPEFAKREEIQKERFNLPLLPTTTIGSFPQTTKIKNVRSSFRKGEISEKEYIEVIKNEIAACVKTQEELGLDVLVHGEFERNDMVEYFGECLDGYIFTKKAWVQSYGTRCVKPPVVWGDISRRKPMTVEWSKYAASLTDRPMKGMLTGPVTILNWSFPREDISLCESAFQIAHAIREEVLDLEAAGIGIIQVDEAALREKLPLRKADWKEDYLDWAINAFRYVHSGVKAETQIHTHMCYSEFADIITYIDNMDADVITFEASRSDLTLLDVLKENNFRTEVGPGVYDIHSPRIPSKEEIKEAIHKMLQRIPTHKLWVNPDCGLKTRGNEETIPSLKNLVDAAREVRNENR